MERETLPGVVASHPGVNISALAGQPVPREMLVDVVRLEREYFERRPDLSDPRQVVSFGTSGHRGSQFSGTFTEAHILAITQAICDYRLSHDTDGPLCLCNVYKIHAESFHNEGHLSAILSEVQEIVANAMNSPERRR